MFKRILIPTDGSEFSRDALAQGLDLAQVSGAEVTILYALENPYEPFERYSTGHPEYMAKMMEDYRAQASNVLREISSEAKAHGVEVHTVIAEEHPVSAILEAAKEHDLVVMATHNRKGIERVMMGSVTDKVLHNCSTPVLVVRGASG